MKQTSRHFRISARRSPAAWVCLGLVFVACGGTSGGNCNTVPNPGGNTGNNTGGNNNNPAPVVLATDHTLGSASAPLTVVEYSEFKCPFCRNFALQTFPQLKTAYIDTGKIRYVFRHFPLRSIHPRAEAAAMAAECAHDQGAFFPYHDLLFANQTSASADPTDTELRAHAATLSLDTTTFNACQAGATKQPRVQQDVNSGTALGISSTPTFFIGNEKVAGFQTFDQIKQIIDRKLAGG